MSYQAVQAVLERTLSDNSFRARLFNDPSQALLEYDLAADEAAALRELCDGTAAPSSAALGRRETNNVLPLWLTGGV